MNFTWIPFYTELADKLLEYKDNRAELVNFIYSEDGLGFYTNYIHAQDKDQKVDDIDPFSFFGIFNTSNKRNAKLDNRIEILRRIKNKFNLMSEIPSDFDGIPVLNYLKSFFFNWNDISSSCNALWKSFESLLNNESLASYFNEFGFSTRKAFVTMPLFWIKPNVYLALDSQNKTYFSKVYNIDINKITDYNSYLEFLNSTRDKMNDGAIKEKSFVELSANAFKYQNKENMKASPTINSISKSNGLKNFLLANHNIILTGAPGTGKTYLVKELAKEIGCGAEEIGFVQFHPSYDYTDFVEGLRPIKDEHGNVGFERKDGIFKAFCKKALKNLIDSNKTIATLGKEEAVNIAINNFVLEAKEKETPLMTSNKVEFKIYDSTDKHLRIYIPKNEKSNDISVSISKLSTLLLSDKDFSSTTEVKNFFNCKVITQHDTYLLSLYNYLKDKIADVDEVQSVPERKYVFIIDEINRGEISKIFGELFFSIDPGYRGVAGKVSTQYQNMIDDDDEFKDGFYIPENVYIIGTMNDIDRSVESMDFAFRRRFAFKEIKANENIGMLEALDEEVRDEAIIRMKTLNEAISNCKNEGLSSAYHIGASYFLKLNDYNNDFNQLWECHIEGLLREYLRGNPDVDSLIGKLESAYNSNSQDVASENI